MNVGGLPGSGGRRQNQKHVFKKIIAISRYKKPGRREYFERRPGCLYFSAGEAPFLKRAVTDVRARFEKGLASGLEFDPNNILESNSEFELVRWGRVVRTLG